MISNVWIISGIICAVFSLFAIPYGFLLKSTGVHISWIISGIICAAFSLFAIPYGFHLKSSSIQVESLNKEISRLEKEHQKTYFTVTKHIDESQIDGSQKYKFKLTPVGSNIIPIFTIQCSTQNKTKITEFKVTGNTIPMMSYDKTAKDKSAISKEYRAMYPGEVVVEITTERHPGKLNVGIAPLKDVKSK